MFIKNEWKVIDHIFKPVGQYFWNYSHAQVPLPYLHPNGTLRIFYATRDENSCSCTSFIDVNPLKPEEIIYTHNKPVLSKGKRGLFDDSGTMPSCLVSYNEKLFLYYTAWNVNKSTSYRLSIGIAVSTDHGMSFRKIFNGPILDRDVNDSIWVGQPWVIIENGIWRMWYLSCSKIEVINNHPEPFYNIKYAESKDGLSWTRSNIVCIDFDFINGIDAIGRPCVFKESGKYKMFYSIRNANGYRTDKLAAYKIAYSESVDGLSWQRKQFLFQSETAIPWAQKMQEYASFYSFKGNRFLLFNGDGFGYTGFGYAMGI